MAMSSPASRGSVVWLSTDPQAPSFRHRLAPVMPVVESLGWRNELRVLPERLYGWRIWQLRHLLRASSAVVLHKLRLEPWEMRLLQRLQPRSMFDLDDAIWLRQPKYIGHLRPASPRRRRNFEAACRLSRLVTVGNAELARHATAGGASRVEIVPTPVDAAAYPAQRSGSSSGATLAWVGLPHNLAYLAPLRPVLARLAQRHPELKLRVISSDWPDWDDVPIEKVHWSAEGETAAIAGADIGLMPLSDDPFARGKCAFKLLQYMAAGLPCVASPVGANCEVVVPGQTGWLANKPAEWEHALETLIQHPEQRQAMGTAGRQRVLTHYDRPLLSGRMARLIDRLASGQFDRPAKLRVR